MLNIPDLENSFQMNIHVFQLLENQTVVAHYKSLSTFEKRIYLDLQENHLSYVKDIDAYAKRFQCQRCDRLFNRYYNLKRHYGACFRVTKIKFPGRFHKTHQFFFDELEKYGICVSKTTDFSHISLPMTLNPCYKNSTGTLPTNLSGKKNMFQFQLGWGLMWRVLKIEYATSITIWMPCYCKCLSTCTTLLKR